MMALKFKSIFILANGKVVHKYLANACIVFTGYFRLSTKDSCFREIIIRKSKANAEDAKKGIKYFFASSCCFNKGTDDNMYKYV